MVIITFLCSVYYNVIIAWTFYYMFASFRSTLPWEKCEPAWSNNLCKYVKTRLFPLLLRTKLFFFLLFKLIVFAIELKNVLFSFRLERSRVWL